MIYILNQGGKTDSVLLDFSKAFDKVDHQKLCEKPEHYDIGVRQLSQIKSFLSQRTQQVVVDGKFSSLAQVKSGAPQGTGTTSFSSIYTLMTYPYVLAQKWHSHPLN